MVACLFYVVYNIHNKNVYSIEKTGGYTVREIRLKARAKINLTLDVTGKREDGYHLLETIMQTVALYDGIYMKKLEKPVIKLKTNLPWLPTDARNLAWKAANLMRETFDSTVSFQLAGVKDAPCCGRACRRQYGLCGCSGGHEPPVWSGAFRSTAGGSGGQIGFGYPLLHPSRHSFV